MFNTIDEALLDLRAGKLIIVVDDENRENEGDLIGCGENISYESLNFMATQGRGLICVPMTEKRAEVLGLNQMVARNTDSHGTAFTVSVDSSKETTTGISIGDRLKTIGDLALHGTSPEDFKRPGHIFPLVAKNNGVIERQGHTEAAVDLARLAGFSPVGVICEILKDDGTMARVPDLKIFAEKYNLKLITIKDLVEYRKKHEFQTAIECSATLPTKYGTFKVVGFTNYIDGKEHIALVKGNISGKENVLTRIHSECLTGDVLGSLKCDCGSQLGKALQEIENHGEGVVLYMRQEGRGIGLLNKIKAYSLQEEGLDTVDANLALGFEPDLRDYAVAAQMLKLLNVNSVDLFTNNPRKIQGLEKYGIKVNHRESIQINYNPINENYLKTKQNKLNHMLNY